MLPEGDEQIDQRQWTQQHLEAADVCGSTSLALTPPQADQEVDVLDVNVRGPGQCIYVLCNPATPRSPMSRMTGVCRNTIRTSLVLKESSHALTEKKAGEIGSHSVERYLSRGKIVHLAKHL